jgi:hypothetical protein
MEASIRRERRCDKPRLRRNAKMPLGGIHRECNFGNWAINTDPNFRGGQSNHHPVAIRARRLPIHWLKQ